MSGVKKNVLKNFIRISSYSDFFILFMSAIPFSRFPRATAEELETFGDHCAICWEDMLEARRLPCSHLFHQ